MKKTFKRSLAFLFAVLMMLSVIIVPVGKTSSVQAATKDEVYWNPYSGSIVSYKPGDKYDKYYCLQSIMGCDKKSQIKNLKSSNKDMPVEKCDGYVRVYFGDKAGKTTISCTVRGVKIKKTFKVVKYTNPVKTFSIAGKNYASKFKSTDEYRVKKGFSKKNVTIKAKSGWKIKSVYFRNKSGTKYYSNLNTSSWSKKLTVTGSYAYVSAYLYNAKTGVGETLSYTVSPY